MKWTIVLFLALSLLCLASNSMAADQDIIVEFAGPWSFIRMNDRIVAISPSSYHKGAVFGARKTSLQRGVYTLTLVVAGNSDNKYQQLLVPATADNRAYQILIKPSAPGKPPQDRYVVILPYAPISAFEQPAVDEYTEKASITDAFKTPDQEFGEQEKAYAKGVKIHYKVSSLNATLSGRIDGTVQDISYSETAPVKFSVDPTNDANYYCDIHARQSFKDMNQLLNTQPHKYADFPYYTGNCRQSDPQRYEEKLPSDWILLPAESKRISMPSVLELIRVLGKLNDKLKPNYEGANQHEIAVLLQHAKEYLQNDPPRHVQEGKELADKLNKTRRILGKTVSPRRSNAKRTLTRGLGALINIVVFSNNSGANCKAPMMDITF